MADKDEEDYTESDIVLDESSYPKFSLENDHLSFVFAAAPATATTLSAEDEDTGTIDFCTAENKNMLYSVKFVKGKERVKLDRVSVRYEKERNLLYFRFRKFLRQEFSMEVEFFEEDDVLVDFDRSNRIIGWALLNASTHVPASCLANLVEAWINIVVYNDGLDDSAERPKKVKQEKARGPKPKVQQSFASQPSSGAASPASPPPQSTKPGRKQSLLPGNEGYQAEKLAVKTPYWKHKFARDLHWTVSSPFLLVHRADSNVPLLTDWSKFLNAPAEELLAYIDAHPEEFFSWTIHRKFRGNNLGGYFTLLVNWWLLHCGNIDQLFVKYQLYCQETKRTLGDFDFLFLDKATEEWMELECGIKFYLLLPNSKPSKEGFQGPHCTGDSLEKYLFKIQRQLNTKNDKQMKIQLEDLGVFPTRSSIFLKGWMYFPLTSEYYGHLQRRLAELKSRPHTKEMATNIFPELVSDKESFETHSINPSHLCGWWAKFPEEFKYTSDDEFPEETAMQAIKLLSESKGVEHSVDFLGLETSTPEDADIKQDILTNSLWVLLNKQDYLSPVLVTPDRLNPDPSRPADKLNLLSYRQLKAAVHLHFTKNFRSLFVAEVVPYNLSYYKDAPNVIDATHVEVSRGIICGAHWPNPPNFDKYTHG